MLRNYEINNSSQNSNKSQGVINCDEMGNIKDDEGATMHGGNIGNNIGKRTLSKNCSRPQREQSACEIVLMTILLVRMTNHKK